MMNGLFWDTKPVTKNKSVKREAPEPTWTYSDYLPNLADALAMEYDNFTEAELVQCCKNMDLLNLDIETYPNYTILGFKLHDGTKVKTFELNDPDESLSIEDRYLLEWIMTTFTTSSFNGLSFDLPLIKLACAGGTCAQIKDGADMMIVQKLHAYHVFKKYNIDSSRYIFDKHIDLMNVSPKKSSLKKLAGRLHVDRIQELPFDPNTELNADQKAIIKWYWNNDMSCTELLCNALTNEIELRYKMGANYGLNLLSKTNAQIAEAIFKQAGERYHGTAQLSRPNLYEYVGKAFRFNKPDYVKFKTPLMNEALRIITNTDFTISDSGKVHNKFVMGMVVNIGDSSYKIGLGGLHSQEQSRHFVAKDGFALADHDVTSYYPNIILIASLFPASIGKVFLDEYEKIKNDRVEAKLLERKAKLLLDKLGYVKNTKGSDEVAKILVQLDVAETVNESLKVVINGTFGKLGDVYSYLYAPDLLIQTTLTGELSLLMLIEALELQGIAVISANTDGLVTYAHESQQSLLDSIMRNWESVTGFELEHAEYSGLYSRDVNNYFAITTSGKIKSKGVFTESGLIIDPKNEICAMAVKEFVKCGTRIEDTIYNSKDFTKFITIQTVKGGAVKDGEYLGKVVRFYHSNDCAGPIIYANNGNKVPTSDDCRPCMVMLSEMPADIDYKFYIDEAYKLLAGVGVIGQSF